MHRSIYVPSARVILLTALTALASACGSDVKTAADAATDGAKADAAVDVAADVAVAKDADPPLDIATTPNELLFNGDWLLGVQAAPFGDLKIPLRVSLAAEGDLAKGGKIVAFQVRAMSTDLTFTSEPIVTLKDIPVAAGGAFTIDIADFVLPAKASPSTSDVPLVLKLIGKVTGKEAMCGIVEGSVPQFNMALAGSKFKAVPFGKQTTPFESSCEGNVSNIYKGLDTCPTLLPGSNTITSAERSRSFVVSMNLTSRKAPTPIIFLYHGVDGDPEKMIDESGLVAQQGKPEAFILIAPKSERDAKTGKALLKSDWYYGSSLFDTDNPDLVFFDDILKCAIEKLKADPKRVYVGGMSGGGLMSTFLGIHRAKVVAAAAPFSGGYLHPWPTDSGKVPFVFTWGGPKDTAYDQNFDEMAKKVTANLKASGHFLIGCDHGLAHKWPKEGGAYMAKFLLAHTLGGPAPFANGLGDGWPSYCKIY